MENPATWNRATKVISDALSGSLMQQHSGIFGYSPARIIHDALEKEGLLKSAPGEGSELPALIMEIKQAAERAQRMLDHCAIPGHGWDNNVWNAFTRAATPESILKLIELMAALSSPQQEWIDCKQKLPPLLTPVWAWDGSDSVIRILTKNGWKASMGGAVHQISHWQPYSPPAPPVTAGGTNDPK